MELYFKKIIYLIILATFLQVSCMSEDEELSSSLKSDQAGGSPDEAYQDISPPQGKLSLNNECELILNLSATDDVGVTGFYISNWNLSPKGRNANWNTISSTKTFSKSVSANDYIDGLTGNLYVWYKDAEGNVSSSSNVYINQLIQDNASPSGTITITKPENQNSSISVNLTANDFCGVTDYYLSNDSNTPSASASGWIGVSKNKKITILIITRYFINFMHGLKMQIIIYLLHHLLIMSWEFL